MLSFILNNNLKTFIISRALYLIKSSIKNLRLDLKDKHELLKYLRRQLICKTDGYFLKEYLDVFLQEKLTILDDIPAAQE